MLSKSKIEEIKHSVNIVDVIGESIALTKAGRNYLGLCPFHGEKTPSFNVAEDKQFYHCFGCGKSGDVFTFIEEYQGISFADSVRIVAEKAGIELGRSDAHVTEKSRTTHPHQVLYDIHAEASKFYHALLTTTTMGEGARAYLYQRGLTDEVIADFQLGLAPQKQDALYQKLLTKFDETDLLRSGLFNTTDSNRVYDSFQGRIIFPLTDEYGRVVAFSGRIWTKEDTSDSKLAKYKNSRTTEIFNKSYELYHLDKAKAAIKKQREVYLMEGFMDVIAVHRAGIEHAVASMGTALTTDQVGHLRKFCQKIVLTYDGDKAGRMATAKALDELGQFSVEIVSLPDNMDPDEFITHHSPEALVQFLTKSRQSDVEFLIHHLKPENPENLQQEIQFVDTIAPIIASVQSITAQNSYIYKVSDLLPDFDYQQIETVVNHSRLAQREQRSQSAQGRTSAAVVSSLPSVSPRISRLIRTEYHLFLRLAQYPYLLNEYRLREEFSFYTVEIQELYELLKTTGEVSRYDLEQLSPEVQQTWYRMQEEELPEEIGSDELDELERTRYYEQLKRDNQLTMQTVREQAHIGNDEMALKALEQLIAQKRKME